MSAMEPRTYRRSLGSNALAFDEPGRDPQHGPHTSEPSTDLSVDYSIPLFRSDLQEKPDPLAFKPLAPSQRTSILTRVVASGLVVSAFVILVAVGVSNSHVAMQAASTQLAAREISPKEPGLVKEPALVSDLATLASFNASSPRLETPSNAIVSVNDSAPQGQAPATRTGSVAAAPSKMIDADTLAALKTRASRLLALGDIAAARLLLERAANAQSATAAFLLAQTYDPAVLGVRDARSTTDAAMAHAWYRTDATFGSADARKRLAQLEN
jgi:hypothetical protein